MTQYKNYHTHIEHRHKQYTGRPLTTSRWLSNNLKNKDEPNNENDTKHEDDIKINVKSRIEDEPRNEDSIKNEDGP